MWRNIYCVQQSTACKNLYRISALSRSYSQPGSSGDAGNEGVSTEKLADKFSGKDQKSESINGGKLIDALSSSGERSQVQTESFFPSPPPEPSGIKLIDLFSNKIVSDTTQTVVEAPKQPKDTTQRIEADAVRIVLQAIDNVKPMLKVMPNKTKTQITWVPGTISQREARSLALRWIYYAASTRQRKTKGKIAECLALELLLAYQKKGSARQKRDDVHRTALLNRPNVHMRWW